MPPEAIVAISGLTAAICWIFGYATGYKKVQRAWLASKDYEAAREAIKLREAQGN